MITQTIVKKIEKVEKQLFELKQGSWFSFAKQPISLKGAFKKIKISEKDLKSAKKSLFQV
ncbi:MAG: hypothetical protein Q8P07_02050 [bacterium]|nr:hypothetical protein [bacterium]